LDAVPDAQLGQDAGADRRGPAGILLHRSVISAMTHAANSAYPPSLMSVYSVRR
jgi:hypothetical protein